MVVLETGLSKKQLLLLQLLVRERLRAVRPDPRAKLPAMVEEQMWDYERLDEDLQTLLNDERHAWKGSPC